MCLSHSCIYKTGYSCRIEQPLIIHKQDPNSGMTEVCATRRKIKQSSLMGMSQQAHKRNSSFIFESSRPNIALMKWNKFLQLYHQAKQTYLINGSLAIINNYIKDKHTEFTIEDVPYIESEQILDEDSEQNSEVMSRFVPQSYCLEDQNNEQKGDQNDKSLCRKVEILLVNSDKTISTHKAAVDRKQQSQKLQKAQKKYESKQQSIENSMRSEFTQDEQTGAIIQQNHNPIRISINLSETQSSRKGDGQCDEESQMFTDEQEQQQPKSSQLIRRKKQSEIAFIIDSLTSHEKINQNVYKENIADNGKCNLGLSFRELDPMMKTACFADNTSQRDQRHADEASTSQKRQQWSKIPKQYENEVVPLFQCSNRQSTNHHRKKERIVQSKNKAVTVPINQRVRSNCNKNGL